MAETRGFQKFAYVGSGQQTISVDSDQSINMVGIDISVDTDTNFSVKVGTTEILGGNIKTNGTLAQFFTLDFGLGRGTGVPGDALTVQLGAAGAVFVVFVKHTK